MSLRNFGKAGRRIACLAAVLVLTFAENAIADVYRFDDLQSVLGEAAVVARVHLISRTTVALRWSDPWRPVLGEEPSCGHLYKAEVIDSLKGSTGNIEFFSENPRDFAGFDRDYLVVVFRRAPMLPAIPMKESNVTLPDEQIRKLNCALSQEYYVGNVAQTMFSFDPLAENQLGGEWLAPPNRWAPGWCVYSYEPYPKGGETRVFSDRRVVGKSDAYGFQSWSRLRAIYPRPAKDRRDASYPARSWSEVRRVWLENLGDGPYLAC